MGKTFHSLQEIYDYYKKSLKKPEPEPESRENRYREIGRWIAEKACREAEKEVFGDKKHIDWKNAQIIY